MHQISYAGDTFVTSDRVADKVLEYARTLGQAGSDDTIHIPAVDDSGVIWQVQLLIGPASQLVARQVEGDERNLDEDGLLDDLDRRIASFAPPLRTAVTPDPDAPHDLVPEWDELG